MHVSMYLALLNEIIPEGSETINGFNGDTLADLCWAAAFSHGFRGVRRMRPHRRHSERARMAPWQIRQRIR